MLEKDSSVLFLLLLSFSALFRLSTTTFVW